MDYEKKYKEMKARVLEIGQGYVKGVDFSKPRQIAEYIDPELVESEDEKIRTAILNHLKKMWGNANDDVCGIHVEDAIAWLEKQGEQKPADKVEQKFKVGDWVIFNNHHESIYQVEKIENYRYCLRHYLGGLLSIHYDTDLLRLWTIQDAKDGDVLAEDSCIFIIKKLNHDNSDNAEIFCCLFDDGDFELNSSLMFSSTSTYPATKEQRDVLFQKMKETGYEWDSTRKELKKLSQQEVIETSDQGQKSNWSEEDESWYNYLHDELNASLKDYCGASLDDMTEAIKWFESIRDRFK